LSEIEAQILQIEGFVVGLDSADVTKLYPKYPMSIASPGRMRGYEWLEQFSKWYPDVDVVFPAERLTLADLRVRYTAY
jgi:hypothetical protein